MTLPAATATYTLEVAGKQDTVTVAGKGSGANTEPRYVKLRETGLSDTRRVENLIIKRDLAVFTLSVGLTFHCLGWYTHERSFLRGFQQ